MMTPLEYVLAITKPDTFCRCLSLLDIQAIYDNPKARWMTMAHFGIEGNLRYSVALSEAFRPYIVDKAAIELLEREMKKYKGISRLALKEGRQEESKAYAIQFNRLRAELMRHMRPLTILKRKYKSSQKLATI